MAEEASVEPQEITLEMFDGEQETPKAESTPVEAEKPVEKTPEAEPKEEAKAEPEAETRSDEAEKPEEVVEKPLAKAEERKAQLNAEIRDLVSQRNTIRTSVEKANAEVYQVATEDELVQQGMSAIEAKVETMRQENEVSKYNERVAEAQLTIGHESQRVLQDFPMFRQYELGTEKYDQQGNVVGGVENPEFDQELTEEAATLLGANLILDPHTRQVIGSNISPYQLYQTLAKASGMSAVKGRIKGREDTEEMLASADSPASTAPSKKAVDPVLELWKSDD